MNRITVKVKNGLLTKLKLLNKKMFVRLNLVGTQILRTLIV